MAEKRMLSDYPELVDEWDFEKNIDHNLSDAFSGRTKLWWKCSLNHSWEAVLTNRINGSKCPYCSGNKILPGFNDVFTLRPDLVDEWDYETNDELNIDPLTLGVGSHSKVWWKCDNDDKHTHSYESSIASRNRGRGCPYCANKKVLVGFNDFATTSSRLLKEWNYEKNSLTPYEITSGSDKKVYWLCDQGHSYQMSVYRRTNSKNSRGCPVCAGKIVIPGVNDFSSQYPELSEMWDYERNETTPDMISYGSSKEFFWIDKNCGHSFKKSPKTLVQSTGCPYCSSTNKKVLRGFNDLETLFPEIAKEWHLTKNGNVFASDVAAKSGQQYWWICSQNKDHEWLTTIHNRTGLNSGCPDCWKSQIVSKAETELNNYVRDLGFNPITDRKILAGKEIDIYIPEKKFAIEYNGLYWHSEKGGKDRNYHYQKWEEAKKQGIYLMHIWEDDFAKNSELIKEMIAYKLGVDFKPKTFARKTVFEKISSNMAKDFLNKHHLQGYYQAAVHYGLKDRDTDEILSVMSVKYSKKNHRLEISRFASKISVVGGFSKLLNHILKEDKYSDVVEVYSYSHNDHSDGNVYDKNGFIRIHNGSPGYFYIVSGRREHRLNFTKDKFKKDKNLIYEEGKTEKELADLNGLNRIWDCGSSLWIKKLSR